MLPDVWQERDLDRTVGINTGHIHTTDFVLKEPDRDFVVEVMAASSLEIAQRRALTQVYSTSNVTQTTCSFL